jgi:hypothetical protein
MPGDLKINIFLKDIQIKSEQTTDLFYSVGIFFTFLSVRHRIYLFFQIFAGDGERLQFLKKQKKTDRMLRNDCTHSTCCPVGIYPPACHLIMKRGAVSH